MADAAIGFAASDKFAIHSNFKEQASSERAQGSFAVGLDANGDQSCVSGVYDYRTDYTTEYLYCGSGIKADAVTLPTNLSVSHVLSSKSVDQVTLAWSNTSQPTLSISGHDHAVNTHTTSSFPRFDWSGVLPPSGGGGIGIPTLGASYELTFSNDTLIHDLTILFTVEHIDVLNSSGHHLAGMIRNGRLELSVSGVGRVADINLGAYWTVDDNDQSDSNTGADTWAVSAHRAIGRT